MEHQIRFTGFQRTYRPIVIQFAWVQVTIAGEALPKKHIHMGIKKSKLKSKKNRLVNNVRLVTQ